MSDRITLQNNFISSINVMQMEDEIYFICYWCHMQKCSWQDYMSFSGKESAYIVLLVLFSDAIFSVNWRFRNHCLLKSILLILNWGKNDFFLKLPSLTTLLNKWILLGWIRFFAIFCNMLVCSVWLKQFKVPTAVDSIVIVMIGQNFKLLV